MFITNTIKKLFAPMTPANSAPSGQVKLLKTIDEHFNGLALEIGEAKVPPEAREYVLGRIFDAKVTSDYVLNNTWGGGSSLVG